MPKAKIDPIKLADDLLSFPAEPVIPTAIGCKTKIEQMEADLQEQIDAMGNFELVAGPELVRFKELCRKHWPNEDDAEPPWTKIYTTMARHFGYTPEQIGHFTIAQLNRFLPEALAVESGGKVPALDDAPDPVALAVAMMKDHPVWSARKLAKQAGCSHTTLTRNSTYQRAKALAAGKRQPRRGTKGADGTIEAVDDCDKDDE